MEETKLIAKKRILQGTGNSRRLRATGGLPGVIYGSEKEPVAIEIDCHEFELVLHHHASESMLLTIGLEGEGDVAVLVKEVQHHPVSSELVHVDFQRVSADRPIHVEIPLELIGEAVGVKAGGILDHVMHAIAVECLPGDLVESFDIDVSGMSIGDTLHVSDLQLGPKFKLLADEDAMVAAVSGPRTEEEEAGEGAEGSAEPEVISRKKEEDSE